MLDWVVLFVVLVAPQGLMALAWDGWPLNSVENGWLAWAWVVLTVSIPSWVCFTLCASSRRGATAGKRVMKLAVRDQDGGERPRSRALLRTAIKLLPWELTHVMIFLPEPFGETLTPFKIAMIVLVNALMVIWLVAPIANPSRRALHDLVTGTVVANSVQPMATGN